MCFNATTSLITFCISLFCFFYLLYFGLKTNNKSDIFLSILTILIGLMQFIEYFLWNNQSCNNTNHIFSLLIIVVLYLQGIIMNIVFFILYPAKHLFSYQFVFIIGLLYTFFTAYILYYLNSKKLCSKPSFNTCRLTWAPYSELSKIPILIITHLFFYFLMPFFIFYNNLNNNQSQKYPIRLLFLPITFFLAIIFVILTEINNKFDIFHYINYADVFGSIWCFMAVFIGIIGILHI
jgi:hypothetical protein